MGSGSVFRAVVTADHERLTPPGDDLLEGRDHSLGWQGKVNLNAQCLSVAFIDHIEEPQTPSEASALADGLV